MIGHGAQVGAVSRGTVPDDLSREVYCILGMPIDAVGMPSVVRTIETAAARKSPFFISTPNLNFLVNSLSDPNFRESLLLSDLCPADGMPIIWIAWLFGIPLKNRIAGCDIFDALKAERNRENPMKVFLFGGAEGVASAAARALNVERGGLYCVGSLYPGLGSADEMSRCEIIDHINSSDADLLVTALGAKKGQLWLQRNHYRLRIPVRTHLGALVNFQAGTLKRAPRFLQKLGLEWLWRIKEEPSLWRRYWNDGRVLLRLMFTRILPLAIWTWWLHRKYGDNGQDLVISEIHHTDCITVSLSGPAVARHVGKVVLVLKKAIGTGKRIVIDFSNARVLDARFLGLLLMLRKTLNTHGTYPTIVGLSPELERIFRLNSLEFMLSSDKGA